MKVFVGTITDLFLTSKDLSGISRALVPLFTAMQYLTPINSEKSLSNSKTFLSIVKKNSKFFMVWRKLNNK